jgi:hypothetical protein
MIAERPFIPGQRPGYHSLADLENRASAKG